MAGYVHLKVLRVSCFLNYFYLSPPHLSDFNDQKKKASTNTVNKLLIERLLPRCPPANPTMKAVAGAPVYRPLIFISVSATRSNPTSQIRAVPPLPLPEVVSVRDCGQVIRMTLAIGGTFSQAGCDNRGCQAWWW